MLKPLGIAFAVTVMAAGAAYAEKSTGTMSPNSAGTTGAMNYEAARPMDTMPSDAMAITNWQDKNVYDPSENKIGEIKDMLVDKSGKIHAVIVSVGGFLGMGEKDVAIPFSSVYSSQRNGKTWLTINATKDTLKNAVGYRYDRTNGSWTVGRMD